MGRLNTLTENGTNAIISSATYGPAGNLTQMTGAWGTESRGYNAMLQMTPLSSSGLSVTYNYSTTQNNGKIVSQAGPVSRETITYTYDSLNRLASATSSGAGPLWGQSYAYDGFGNLTDITTTQGSTPEWHQSYSAATNRAGTDVADANGNIGSGCQSSGCYNYDVENRIISSAPLTTVQYAYAPDNKRVWRSDWSNGSRTVDEVSFWSVTGQRVATFNLVSYQASLRPVQTATEYYFGGKLVKNGTGYVYSDRLGSIGQYYPYGQERPSATTNGTEKFTGYLRDAETGLDYAVNRYHAPGQGRFLSPDPGGGSYTTDPNTLNLYAYVNGDPINLTDPDGLDISFPITTGPANCSTEVIELAAKLGYGGSDGLTNFFRSDLGRLGLTVFSETRPEMSSFQPGALANFGNTQENSAVLGVAYVFVNRYLDRNKGYGFVGSSLTDIILQNVTPSDWVTSGADRGDLQAGNLTLLSSVLKGSQSNPDCNGLLYSFEMSGAVMAATVGYHWTAGALPQIYNPVGYSVFFQNSSTPPVSDFWNISRFAGFTTINGNTLNFFDITGPKPQPTPPPSPSPSPGAPSGPSPIKRPPGN